MIFRAKDGDDGLVLTLDEEGIDYLERGLQQLRDADPGEEVTTPSLESNPETGSPIGVSEFILRRAA